MGLGLELKLRVLWLVMRERLNEAELREGGGRERAGGQELRGSEARAGVRLGHGVDARRGADEQGQGQGKSSGMRLRSCLRPRPRLRLRLRRLSLIVMLSLMLADFGTPIAALQMAIKCLRKLLEELQLLDQAEPLLAGMEAALHMMQALRVKQKCTYT